MRDGTETTNVGASETLRNLLLGSIIISLPGKVVNKSESERVSCSVVSNSANPWTIAHQAPVSMGFSRQYWSGLPFPSPRDLPEAEIESGFPALQADSLPSEPPVKQWDKQKVLHSSKFQAPSFFPSAAAQRTRGQFGLGQVLNTKSVWGCKKVRPLIRERRDNPSKPSVILTTERAGEKKLEV